MKVFVDECVTYDLMPHLTGHLFMHIADTPLRARRTARCYVRSRPTTMFS